jgi:hypothetical protein
MRLPYGGRSTIGSKQGNSGSQRRPCRFLFRSGDRAQPLGRLSVQIWRPCAAVGWWYDNDDHEADCVVCPLQACNRTWVLSMVGPTIAAMERLQCGGRRCGGSGAAAEARWVTVTRRWACPRITTPGLTGGAGTTIPHAATDGVPRELRCVC